ncbi:MAG TPA: BrnT family toxin [Azospirillum sp.]
MEFEWDEAKNAANIAKHGIDFPAASRIFVVSQAVWLTTHASEPRWIIVGPVENTLFAVIFTRRGDRIRIISTRRARTHERRAYRAIHPGDTASR